MRNERRFHIDVGSIFALALIVLGTLLVLDRLNVSLRFDPWDYWPVVVILIGIVQILQPRETRHTLAGLFLMLVGLLFLASNLHWISHIHLTFGDIWPFFIVFVGVMLLERHFHTPPQQLTADKDYIRLSAILGGGGYNFNSKSLKGGTITAIMGGCTLDLRQAEMEADSMVIDTFTVWGGIELKVPEHWSISIQASPILGGVENKTSNFTSNQGQAQKAKLLIIKGVAIMGGVEVKN